MLLASGLITILTLVRGVLASPPESFVESLTLHPLPDGKLSVLFEFTTHFASSQQSIARGVHGSMDQQLTKTSQSHHRLTPPSLLLPLEHNNVSELTISFVAGQWDQRRTGEAGPLHYEAGGGGGEVRGWLKGNQEE